MGFCQSSNGASRAIWLKICCCWERGLLEEELPRFVHKRTCMDHKLRYAYTNLFFALDETIRFESTHSKQHALLFWTSNPLGGDDMFLRWYDIIFSFIITYFCIYLSRVHVYRMIYYLISNLSFYDKVSWSQFCIKLWLRKILFRKKCFLSLKMLLFTQDSGR